MLKTTLSNAGYSPFSTPSGREAIKLAQERSPSLIILDILMPDMDGGEVADILRKDPQTRDIPIIFLSVLISEQEERTGRRKNAGSLLSKPYNRDKLLNEVRKYLAGPES
jgi:two-component system sensor histidine kinase/response regulator